MIDAVVATQESAVTELPARMQSGEAVTEANVAPLPLGPKERAYFFADGNRERATAAELGVTEDEAAGAEQRDLFYFDPTAHGDDVFRPAYRANLRLRNTAGDVVDDQTWLTQNAEETEGMWSRSVSSWASGQFPPYRIGMRHSQDAMSVLWAATP